MIAQLKPIFPGTSPFPGYALPPLPPGGTRVVLLRHGRSTLNDAGRYQGSSDESVLTPGGMEASRRIGRYLQDCPIDAIYVSPLRRAQATAAALVPALQARRVKGLVTSPLLREIHLPAWEGLRYDEVRSRDPDAYQCWRQTPEQFQMKAAADGETVFYPVQDLYRRAQQFWQQTLKRHRGQTLLVVSHGGTNQALINTALGLSPRQHHALQQTHSGLTVLDLEASVDPTARLHLLNLTLSSRSDHTNSRLPKLKSGKQGLRLLLLPCDESTLSTAAVANLLQGESLRAAVVEVLDDSGGHGGYPCHQVAKSLLAHSPEAVVFSVQRSHFWPQRQAAIIRSLRQQDRTELTTILAIAQSESLQRFLTTLLALPEDRQSLPLQPNTLSVVHYPNAQEHPILQGMNLSPAVLQAQFSLSHLG